MLHMLRRLASAVLSPATGRLALFADQSTGGLATKDPAGTVQQLVRWSASGDGVLSADGTRVDFGVWIDQTFTAPGTGTAVRFRPDALVMAKLIGTIGSGTISTTGQIQGTKDPAGATGWENLLSTPLALTNAASGAQDVAAHASLPYLWIRPVCVTLTTGGSARFVVPGA